MPVKLTDEGHPLKLRNRIKELYRKKTFSDILLRSSDGSTYRTHRLVLAIYSDFFKPFASRKNQNGNQALEVVDLDIKANILSSLVDYIYKGYIEIEPNLQTELKKAAKVLKLQDVLSLLEERAGKHENSDSQKALGAKEQPGKSTNAKNSHEKLAEQALAKGRPKRKSAVSEQKDDGKGQSISKGSGEAVARRQPKRRFNVPDQRHKESTEVVSDGPPQSTSKRQPKRKSTVSRRQVTGKGAKRAKRSSKDSSIELNQNPNSDFEIELDVCEDEHELEMEPVHQLKVEAANETWFEHLNLLPSVALTPLQMGSLEEDNSTRDSYELEETESKASVLKQLEITESMDSPSAYGEQFAVEETKFNPQDQESPGNSISSSTSNVSVSDKNNRVASEKGNVLESEIFNDVEDDFELLEIDEDDDNGDNDYNPDEDLCGPFILKTPRPTSKKVNNKTHKTSNTKRRYLKVENFKKLHIAKKQSKRHKFMIIAAKIVNQKLMFLCGDNAILKMAIQSKIQEGEKSLGSITQYKCTLCNKSYKYKSVCRGHIHKMHVQKKIGKKHKKLREQKFEKYILPPQTRKLKKKHSMKIGLKSKQLKTGKQSAASPEVYFPSRYKCLICERLLKDRQTLRQHLQSVHKMSATEAGQHKSNLNNCEVPGCDFSTFKIRELVNHVKSAHPEIEHKCPVCNFTFYLTTALNRHMLLYHINRDKLPYQCSVCDKKLTGLREKKLHEANKHGIVNDLQKFECPVEGCGFSTYMKDSLKVHANVHKDTSLPCPHCDKKLKGKKTLQNHINRIHLNIRPFLCQNCGNSYGDPFALKAHIESKHSEEKKYKCEHCPYQTSVKMQFTAHCLRIHDVKVEKDKRDFPCPHCPYRGVIKSHLRMHMAIHTKEPICSCEICGDTFYTKGALRSHKKWRHPDTMYRCSYCQYTSKSTFSITYHTEQQHTMSHIRPYECQYCDFNCATSGNMRKHIMGKHKGKEVKYRKNEELIAQLVEMRKKQAPIQPEPIKIKEKPKKGNK